MVKQKVGAILVIVGMQLLIFGVICSQWVYIRIGLGNQYILGRSLLSTLGILFMILGNAFYRVLYRPHEEHASTKEKYGKPKNVLLRIEWKKWYPLKKFIAFLLWNICLFTVLISTIFYCSEQETDSKTLFGYIIFIITTIATFSPMRKYVSPKYRCLPHIGDVLSKTELNKMLGDEDFQGIEKFKEMSIYPYVKESRNWFWIGGLLLHKKMVVAIDFGLRTAPNHMHSRIKLMYVDGGIGEIILSDLYYERSTELYAYLWKRAGILGGNAAGIPWHEKNTEIARKYLNNSKFGKMNFYERMKHVDEIRMLLMEKFGDEEDKIKYQIGEEKASKAIRQGRNRKSIRK